MSFFSYKDGTITLENGSADVAGDGTLWLSAVTDGDQLLCLDAGSDFRLYEISIGDDAHATLDRPYSGASGADLPYMIFRNSAARNDPTFISKQLSDFITTYRKLIAATGPDRLVTLDKAASGNNAGIRLQTGGQNKLQIGAFGDDDFAVQFLTGEAWTKGLNVSAADGTVSILSQLVLGGILDVGALTGDQDDYAPAGIDTASVLRVSPTNDLHLTGLVGGKQGRMLALMNPSAHQILLDHEATGSVAANRFRLPTANIIIGAGQAIILFYDNTSRWVLMSSGGGDSGGADGWSPVFALVSDGARRVLQITDWQGGTGLKPSTLGYVGPTGIVTDAASAIDIRGPQGSQGDQGIQGIQGIPGEQGIQGNPGAAATIAVGDVTTGAPGSPVAITNVGTPEAAIFDFAIPQGEKGDKGEPGSGSIAGATLHGIGLANGPDSMTSTAAPTDGQLLIGQSGADPALRSVSGDATLSKFGVLTVSKINGVAVGTAAFTDASAYATAAQGDRADSAVQPEELGNAAVKNVGTAAGTVAAGDDARMVNAVQKNATATISVGYSVAPNNLGTLAGWATPVNPALGNYQHGTNNGAFTVTAPASDCAIDLWVFNSATAGAVTFSGFTVGASTGDAFTTTNGHRFIVQIRRVNGVSAYAIKALQ